MPEMDVAVSDTSDIRSGVGDMTSLRVGGDMTSLRVGGDIASLRGGDMVSLLGGVAGLPGPVSVAGLPVPVSVATNAAGVFALMNRRFISSTASSVTMLPVRCRRMGLSSGESKSMLLKRS